MSSLEHTAAIINQMEFYFGPGNLPNDTHLHKLMGPEGWVVLAEMCAWPRMVRLGATDAKQVAKALLTYSTAIEVDHAMEKVRPKHPQPQVFSTFPPHNYQLVHMQHPLPHMIHPLQHAPYFPHPDQTAPVFVPQFPASPHHFIPQAYPMHPPYNPQMYPYPTENPLQFGTMYASPAPMHHEQMGIPQQMVHAIPQLKQQPVPNVGEQMVGAPVQRPHADVAEQGFDAHMQPPMLNRSPSQESSNASDRQSPDHIVQDSQVPLQDTPRLDQPTGCGEPGPVQFGGVYVPPTLVYPEPMVMQHQTPYPIPQPMQHPLPYGREQQFGAQFQQPASYAGEQGFGDQMQQPVLIKTPSQVSSNGSNPNTPDSHEEDYQVSRADAHRPRQNMAYGETEAVLIERVASEVSSEGNESFQNRGNGKQGAPFRGSSPARRNKKENRRRDGEGHSEGAPRETRHGTGFKKPYIRFPRQMGNEGGSGSRKKTFHRMYKGRYGNNSGHRGQEYKAEIRRQNPDLHAENFPPLPHSNGSDLGQRHPKAPKEVGNARPTGGVWANKPAAVLAYKPAQLPRARHHVQQDAPLTPVSVS